MVKGFKERDGSQPGTSSGRQALAAEGGPCNAASFALLETVRLALESSEAEEQNSGGHTTSEGYTSSDHYVPDAAPRRRVANINAARHALPGGPCAHCSALESPQWRRHLGNNCVLCNACGIFYRRHQCLPARKKEADHPRRPKAEPVDLEDDHMMGCSDDNENPTRGDAPRGRESASSMEWPAVLHTTAMEPTALKQEGGGGAFGLGFGACHGRPAALMLDLPTLATASSITDGAHGGCGHGQGQGHGGGGALRRAASGGMGGGSSRGPGTPRRTGAILEALLESPPHAGDGGDEYGRRVRSRGPTPHGTPKGGGGGGGGRGGGSFAPPGASAFASQPSVMAALMASVLRQSLGVADPSMHALAAGTSLPHPYTHPHSMHTSASCPVVEERPRREVATGVVQVQVQQSAGAPGAAFFLPKATCRGPSFLAATKSV
ncbi:hypothetical protein FOA52_015990 [Chlamydomonas sp. UWO 241]|nr:hypothetical protein FOA52_015990 [Chlamydomonas sp. UWO 241]